MTYDNETLTIIAPYILPFLLALWNVYLWYGNRIKRKTDNADILTGTALELVGGLRLELARSIEINSSLIIKIKELEDTLGIMSAALKERDLQIQSFIEWRDFDSD